MLSKTKYRIVIVGLLITNAVTAIFLAHSVWCDRMLWPTQMYGMAGYAATLQASADFRSGKTRILEISDDVDVKFTGRTTGPFEIWTWPHHPVLGRPEEYTTQTFVEFYNRRMRAMQKHPEKYDKKDAEQNAPHLPSEGAPLEGR